MQQQTNDHFRLPEKEIYVVTKEGDKVEIYTVHPFPEGVELLADYDTKKRQKPF